MPTKKDKPYNLSRIEDLLDSQEWRTWYSPIVKRAPTYSEAFLAYLLDSLEISYQREYKVDMYPLDFAFPELNLLVDIDSPCYRRKGGVTGKKKKGDNKEAYLRKRGWEFYRFRFPRKAFDVNIDLLEDYIDGLLDLINILKTTTNHNKE